MTTSSGSARTRHTTNNNDIALATNKRHCSTNCDADNKKRMKKEGVEGDDKYSCSRSSNISFVRMKSEHHDDILKDNDSSHKKLKTKKDEDDLLFCGYNRIRMKSAEADTKVEAATKMDLGNFVAAGNTHTSVFSCIRGRSENDGKPSLDSMLRTGIKKETIGRRLLVENSDREVIEPVLPLHDVTSAAGDVRNKHSAYCTVEADDFDATTRQSPSTSAIIVQMTSLIS
jgi:hypothetical protein